MIGLKEFFLFEFAALSISLALVIGAIKGVDKHGD